ncbi:MAG TPA: UDP-glucose 4-epimerase GalE [Candidatus Limnocylindrales bacterium]|nr:UDP-glucose 4-epimerase GalE [Candidatus Limnocylindrales bacterium]
MRVLVTGGAGYVGSTSAEQLIEAGHEVVAYDSLELGHRAAVPETAKLIVGDLADLDLLSRTLTDEHIEAVLHCAGRSLVGESVLQPDVYFRANVVGGIGLLDVMRASGVSRIVFSSSAGVYGAPDQLPIDEHQPLQPINPYGETKRTFEAALRWYASAFEMSAVSVRYFNAAGATDERGEDHDPEAHLIPNILSAAVSGPPVKIFGTDYPTPDGTCIRDYVHVKDLADAHIAALVLTSEIKAKHVVCNLGSGSGYSNLEVLRAAEEVVGHPIPFTLAARREGDPPVLVASNERARELLGWQPRRGSLAEMIGSAWRWRQRHPNGYG